jgi:hypothetical protein
MQILDNLIIVLLPVIAFVAGLKLSDHYNKRANIDRENALRNQFVRLRAQADADDPVKPYIAPQTRFPFAAGTPQTGDYDGDGPITPQFMEELKKNGTAKTSFRKSDIAG